MKKLEKIVSIIMHIYTVNFVLVHKRLYISETVQIPKGGTLIFSTYLGSGQASTVHRKKNYQEFQAPQKNI